MKHEMLIKKGRTKVKKTIGSWFNSIDINNLIKTINLTFKNGEVIRLSY